MSRGSFYGNERKVNLTQVDDSSAIKQKIIDKVYQLDNQELDKLRETLNIEDDNENIHNFEQE